MTQVKVENITRIKGSTNEDVADAVMILAKPLLEAAEGNDAMEQMILSIAVTAWNLSLYPESESVYREKIEKKLPATLSGENRKVFVTFVLSFIDMKCSIYGELKKGIASHEVVKEDGETKLLVKALPLRPAGL